MITTKQLKLNISLLSTLIITTAWSGPQTVPYSQGVNVATVGSDFFCSHTTVQAALNDPSITEIRLLDGVSYTENITISRSLAINGGYDACLLGTQVGNSTISGAVSAAAPTININHAVVGDHDILLNNLAIKAGSGGAFENNRGGGVNIFGGAQTVIISDSEISLNTSTSSGGGIAVADGGSVVLVDTDVKNNFARSGGGIYCQNSLVSILGFSDIKNNFATGITSGDGGGGVYVDEGCEFALATTGGSGIKSNSTNSFGGGIHATSTESNNPALVAVSPIVTGQQNSLGEAIMISNNKTANDNKFGAAIYANGYVDVSMQRVEIKDHTVGVNLFYFKGNSSLNMHCENYNKLCNTIKDNSLIGDNDDFLRFLASASVLTDDVNHSISFTLLKNNSTTGQLVSTFVGNINDAFNINLKLFRSMIVDNTVDEGLGEIFFTNAGVMDIFNTTFVDHGNHGFWARVYEGGTLNLSHSVLSNSGSAQLLTALPGAIMNIDCTISDYSNFLETDLTSVLRSMQVNDIQLDENYHLATSTSPAVDYCTPHPDDSGFDIDGNSSWLDSPYMIDLYGPQDLGADELIQFDLISSNGFDGPYL